MMEGGNYPSSIIITGEPQEFFMVMTNKHTGKIFKGAVSVLSRSLGVFILLLLFMLLIHISIIFTGLSITNNRFSSEQLFLERLYPPVAAVILIAWSMKKRKGIYHRIKHAIKLNNKNIKVFFKYTVISLSILYISFFLSIYFDYSNFENYGNVYFSSNAILKQYILVGLLGNLFVSFGEEIIFRGFLLNYVIGISRSKLFALLFTSFLFSLHIYPDFLNNVIAFLAGLAMGYAYLKFRTLYIPIGIHFAYSVFNITIASESSRGANLPYLIKFDYPLIADGFGAWVDLFIILGLIVIIAFLFIIKIPDNIETIKKEFINLSLPSRDTKV